MTQMIKKDKKTGQRVLNLNAIDSKVIAVASGKIGESTLTEAQKKQLEVFKSFL